jgi:hypothetical protein
MEDANEVRESGDLTGFIEPIHQQRQVLLIVDRFDHFRLNFTSKSIDEESNQELLGIQSIAFANGMLNPLVDDFVLRHNARTPRGSTFLVCEGNPCWSHHCTKTLDFFLAPKMDKW